MNREALDFSPRSHHCFCESLAAYLRNNKNTPPTIKVSGVLV